MANAELYEDTGVLCERLPLLISLRRVSDSVEASIAASFSPCTKLLHLVFQFSLIILVCLYFSAEGLIVSLCYRRLGRNFLSEVMPAAVLFASLSALSLPSTVCPYGLLSILVLASILLYLYSSVFLQ